MIATVTLNAAIDKTYYVSAIEKGKVNRVPRIHSAPGGKGINVAKVVRQLGELCLATGFVGGKNGEFIEAALNELGIANDFVKVDGESRICLNIIEEVTGESTELLEPGPSVNDRNLEELLRKVRNIARKASHIVMSGSLPKGAGLDFYAQLIRAASQEGAWVILDTSGEALVKGVEAHPFAVKPNEDEAVKLFGADGIAGEALIRSIAALSEVGPQWVIVSLGGKGSIAGFAGKVFRAASPSISAVNPVGSGDAFAAGLAVAFLRNYDREECLRLATAAGAANALNEWAGHVHMTDVEKLLRDVKVERIN